MNSDWLVGLVSPGSELTVLFFASLLAGSVVPIASEVVLFAVLKLNAQLFWPAILVATLGNTAGGITSYALGRFLPEGKSLAPQVQRWLVRVKHFGAPALLLAWLPYLGDPLCVAAGWLRLNIWQCAIFMAIGKFTRYFIIGFAVNGASG